jgi:hypothetical protein
VICLDSLLALLTQVVPPEKFAVALDRELLQNPADQTDFLFPAHAFQGIRLLVLEPG